MLKELEKRVKEKSSFQKSKIMQRFFKTGKGEYGEGDIFLGLTVPESRNIALDFLNLSLDDIKTLLKSKIHENRLIGLLILVERFKNSDENDRKIIYNFYLENTRMVNNWDLVDLSADKILGKSLLHKNKKILYELSKSVNLWERRISIISTFEFIRNNNFKDALKISEILIKDKQDLIHKAIGWMLREIGKRDKKVLERFLEKNYQKMPRTTLRYAIEKFDDKKRKKYLIINQN